MAALGGGRGVNHCGDTHLSPGEEESATLLEPIRTNDANATRNGGVTV